MADQKLQQYVGREQRARDIVARRRIEELAALFDFETEELLGDEGRIPPLAHWLFFNRWPPHYELGADGHPKRGGFMPPIALPRRMFAGGRDRFLQPVRLGDNIERISTIKSIAEKTGASANSFSLPLGTKSARKAGRQFSKSAITCIEPRRSRRAPNQSQV